MKSPSHFREHLPSLCIVGLRWQRFMQSKWPRGLWTVIDRRAFSNLAAKGLMFKILHDIDESTVTITIEGRQIKIPTSDSVAAAMLTAGVKYTRTTPITGAHRAPYCMMGTCQARMYGLTLSETIADFRNVDVSDVGYLRIRPPIKPITVDQLSEMKLLQ